MKNDPNSYHALVGIHRPAFAVSALIILLSVSSVHAADPPVPRGNVSVNVNPTTGYYSSTSSTVRLPNGVSVSPTSASPPVVSKYSGGLQQTIPTGITIDAIKKSAPLPAVVRSTTQSLKGAATRCLTSARCNLGLILAGEGLSRLFDGLDWIMGEGGQITKKTPYTEPLPCASGTACYKASYGGTSHQSQTAEGACSAVINSLNVQTCASAPRYDVFISDTQLGGIGQCKVISQMKQSTAQSCTPYGVTTVGISKTASGSEPSGTPAPVSSSEIEDAVNSSYNPDPTDWRALTPELELDDVEITSAPTLQSEPKTTTVYDADGNPYKVTETNIWYDFDIRDNPSPRPSLDMKTSEETKTYEDGVLTGTTTTNSTSSAGSNDTPPPSEPPIDCDLFPTACAWFDWTQEEPIEPDTDLSGLLQEVPIVSETYTIMGGVAACPAPMVLDLSVFGSREVSYQPLCDLASTMKYLYLALMSFAAAVLLNRSVNRV